MLKKSCLVCHTVNAYSPHPLHSNHKNRIYHCMVSKQTSPSLTVSQAFHNLSRLVIRDMSPFNHPMHTASQHTTHERIHITTLHNSTSTSCMVFSTHVLYLQLYHYTSLAAFHLPNVLYIFLMISSSLQIFLSLISYNLNIY